MKLNRPAWLRIVLLVVLASCAVLIVSCIILCNQSGTSRPSSQVDQDVGNEKAVQPIWYSSENLVSAAHKLGILHHVPWPILSGIAALLVVVILFSAIASTTRISIDRPEKFEDDDIIIYGAVREEMEAPKLSTKSTLGLIFGVACIFAFVIIGYSVSVDLKHADNRGFHLDDSRIYLEDNIIPLEVLEVKGRDYPLGLTNTYDSCYINSMLQVLAWTLPDIDVLHALCESIVGNDKSTIMVKLFFSILNSLHQRELVSTPLLTTFRELLENFSVLNEGGQQDPVEILDIISEAMKTRSYFDDLRERFEDSIAVQYGLVRRCQREHDNYDPEFYALRYLTVNVPRPGLNIQDIVNKGWNENWNEQQMFMCPQCKAYSRCHERNMVALGKILIVKVNTIDVKSLIIPIHGINVVDRLFAPLSAFVVHSGCRYRGGHYFAYLRRKEGGWWIADDSTVTFTEQQVPDVLLARVECQQVAVAIYTS